jgi:beta-N-acetylhexosaminidase
VRKSSKHVAAAAILLVLSACGSSGQALAPSPSPKPSAAASSPSPAPSPTAQLGPGGLTLDEEIGAVMMVGFQGQLTDSVLADFSSHQYGGLLVVNLNHNATTAPQLTAMIQRLRSVERHRLLAATDQEGGFVCIAISTVPCYPMPVGRAQTASMATALHQLGFDVDLGPVSDVCSNSSSIMWGRCYGTNPTAVASAVGPVVQGIHDAHMLSASKHFPGHGDTTVSSETQLPRIDQSLATIQQRGLVPFTATIAQGTDFILMGHLFYPAIDPHHSADLSPATYQILRGELGYTGAILSDDMEMGAITDSTPTPVAAVQFLQAGGDMVMVAHHLSVADATFNAIKAAVLSGSLPRSRLDNAVSTLQRLSATT